MQIELPHSIDNKVTLLNSPIKIPTSPTKTHKAPPTLGEHTEEILKEKIGLDQDTVARLRDEGGGSFYDQAMADRGEPSGGDILDENIKYDWGSDEPIDWESHDLPWLSPPGRTDITPAERKPSQQRLARIMEPEQPLSPQEIRDKYNLDKSLDKFYKAFGLNKENGDDDLRNPYEEHKFDQSLYQQTGMDRLEAVQAGLCAKCAGKSGNYETGEGFTDDASRREYGITGYCQQCQDDFYGSLPPDEPMEKFYKAYVLK